MAKITLTRVDRQLKDYPALLHAIADDIEMGAPLAVLKLRGDELREIAADLEHLVGAYQRREAGR